jgi:hypothetical protein
MNRSIDATDCSPSGKKSIISVCTPAAAGPAVAMDKHHAEREWFMIVFLLRLRGTLATPLGRMEGASRPKLTWALLPTNAQGFDADR